MTHREENGSLRPCPFCGSLKQLSEQDNERGDEIWIHCMDCWNGMTPDPIVIKEDLWQNAYCWKELDKKEERIRELEKEVKEWIADRDSWFNRMKEMQKDLTAKITSLESEIESLKGRQFSDRNYDAMFSKIKSLESEVERLKQALHKIKEGEDEKTGFLSSGDMMEIAKDVLEKHGSKDAN